MVKVQKPIPKTIKKGGPEIQKPQIKKIKANSTKDAAKKVKKTLEVVVRNETNDAKPPSANLNKKAKKVLENVKDTATKKKAIVAQVQKSLKNGVPKKKQALQEAPGTVKKAVSKKSTIEKKIKQPAKYFAMESSVKEQMSKTVRNVPQKKKPLETKEQPAKKQIVAMKNSTLKKESETVERVLVKKLEINTKVHPQVKRTVAKNISALEEELEIAKKVLAKKKSIKAKAQKPVKEAFVEKVNTKKKLATAKEQETVPKNKGKTDTLRKTEKKMFASKVQKKISAEKKTKNSLKNKVKKNVGEIKKTIQDKQDENEKYEKTEPPMYEQTMFDEDKFQDVTSLKNFKKVCMAFKELLEKHAAEKKSLVFTDYNYLLNVVSYKIPNCPKRMVKLNLKHALVDIETDDVVLIVPDLKMGAKVDYEPTIQHYEDLLRENGVENVKIMPFNQLRREYSSFEAKRKLSNTYDHFLCDGRIVGHVVGFCGKHFQKSRTTIHAIHLNKPKTFKSAIERSIKRTSYRQLQKGDLISIPVGSHRFTADQLAENIAKVIDQLKTLFPGGYANMRNIHIKSDIRGMPSLPLYVSLAGAPHEVPNVIGPREQKMLKLKKEANDILSKFSMSKSGAFVKLNKAQVKRKLQIREAREALISKGNVELNENESEINPPLKKKLKKQVEPHNTDDGETYDQDYEVSAEDEAAEGEQDNEGVSDVNDEDEESDEDSDVNDDDEEASEDDNEEDDDDEEASEEDSEVNDEE